MCDTVVAVHADRVLFGKNSDRDANEGQLLGWHAAAEYPPEAVLRATHVTVPQARKTAAVLLSRPFWMWGAEMGANEHGVVIGNEALFTREPVDEVGLLGMDLLRLTLERSASAEQAVEVLRSLVSTHGQGGRATLEGSGLRYHGSFLIADHTGAFVVETQGHDSVVEPVRAGVRTISNRPSIGGFAVPDRVKTRVARAAQRQQHTTATMAGAGSVADVMAVLRDHGEGGPSYRWLEGSLGVPCMHGGGLVTGSVTTGSWVSELTAEGARHWATACAAPDIALYKPVAVEHPVDLGLAPGATADGSRFWRQERLHRTWLRNPAGFGPAFLPELQAVQARWLRDPPSSAAAFAEEDELVPRWIAAVEAEPLADVRPWFARWYWRRREAWALGG